MSGELKVQNRPLTASQIVAKISGSAFSLKDTNFTVTGSSDTTKHFKLEVDTQTTGKTLTLDVGAQTVDRTVLFPVVTGNRTLAVIDQAQTFTAAQTISATLSVTGTTTIGSGSGSTSLIVDGGSSSVRLLDFKSAGSTRWRASATLTPESGSNAGSNFSLSAFDDSGVLIDNPLQINRVLGGLVTLARPVTITSVTASSSTITGALVVSGGAGFAGNIFGGGTLNITGSSTLAQATFSGASGSSSASSVVIGGGQVDVGAAIGLRGAGSDTIASSPYMFFNTGSGAVIALQMSASNHLDFWTNPGSWNMRMRLTAAGSLVMGTAALATNATDGFIYLAGGAGAPTGVPTTQTGRVAMYYDTTNNFLYFYNSGWKKSTVYA